jgi:DNA recombination protein RmuC
MMMVIVAGIVALVVGVAFGVMYSRAALAKVQAELVGRTDALSAAIREIADRKSDLDKRSGEVESLKLELATLQEKRKSDEDRLKELVAAREQFSNHFKALANEIMEEKSKKFTEQNQENLGQLLNPLRTKLAEFQTKVEQVYVEDKTGRAELAEQLRNLMGLNQQLSSDANNLTRALTGSTKVQGDWGELMLERILESCGLRKDIEYVVQQTFMTESGKMVRPDVLLKLPEGRALIVDSKVSLIAYKEYANSEDDVIQAHALRAHLDSVRKHVKELSVKSYEGLPGVKSPDFVIMFIPLEPAFMLAISKDETLWEDAYRQSVLLVSPTTLLFVLRTVSQLWKTELQRQNVDEIAKRGAAMYDKFVGFVEDLKKVGERLEQAKSSYSDAYGKLKSGSGNLVGQAEKMRELGLKPKKLLPQESLELSEDAESEKHDEAKA